MEQRKSPLLQGEGGYGCKLVGSYSVTAGVMLKVPGVARRLVTFLLRQKSNQKRRTHRAAFLFFGFVVADIFVVTAFIEPAAARKLALTFN
jgi:hypothetical protein